MKTDRFLLRLAFASLFLFTGSLFAQQDVDPTWYNPWPDSTKVVSNSTAPASANHANLLAQATAPHSSIVPASRLGAGQPSHPQRRAIAAKQIDRTSPDAKEKLPSDVVELPSERGRAAVQRRDKVLLHLEL